MDLLLGLRAHNLDGAQQAGSVPGGSLVKNLPAMQEMEFPSPWRRKWQRTPVFLSRESHGPRSLAGGSLWGRRVGHN